MTQRFTSTKLFKFNQSALLLQPEVTFYLFPIPSFPNNPYSSNTETIFKVGLISIFIIISILFAKMGNEICIGGDNEAIQVPIMQASEPIQKLQMSTVVPQENGSSNNDLSPSQKLEPNKEEEKSKSAIQHEFQPCQAILKNIPKRNPIHYEAMQVVRKEQKRKRINQFEISAPFKVIFLTLTPGLKHTINELGHAIFQKYQEGHQNGTPGWKLHKNGYYINYLAKKLTAILTENLYFEGQLAEDELNHIFPQSTGILLNEFGKYDGNFQMGKAHGKGTFYDRLKKASYKGVWEDGRLVEGTIDSPEYNFKGKIQSNTVHGEGQLFFKGIQLSYLGCFKRGVFHDIKGKYETNDYIYEGGFLNGKKNGEGTLVEKERNTKAKKTKYRPPCQFIGNWHDDININEVVLQALKEEGKDLAFAAVNERPFMIEDQDRTTDHKVGGALDIMQENLDKRPKFVWVQSPKESRKRRRQVEEYSNQIF